MRNARKIIATATRLKVTITTAESCTGGMVAAALTDIAGASAVFHSGYITYANEAKQKLLSVPKILIAKHGAVSEPVALAMAKGARTKAKATVVVAVTGIAGPSGGTVKKPVGTVYVAVVSPKRSICKLYHFEGNRQQIRTKAAQKALDLLYDSLALLSS